MFCGRMQARAKVTYDFHELLPGQWNVVRLPAAPDSHEPCSMVELLSDYPPTPASTLVKLDLAPGHPRGEEYVIMGKGHGKDQRHAPIRLACSP